MPKHLIYLVIFFFGTIPVFSQETDAQKDLLKRANENHNMFYKDPEKALLEAKEIEKEAKKINAKRAELRVIEMQCNYYGANKDFEKMLTTAKLLNKKAENYKIPVFQVIAKRKLFEAYIFSGLPDKAFRELEQGKEIMNKLKEQDYFTIATKANLLSSYSNYYWAQGDLQNQLKYLLLSGQEIKKIPDEPYREHELFLHYSNIAATYGELNQPDSARAYVELSLSKDRAEYNRNDIRLLNLWTLGKVSEQEENYLEALSYFKKAEKTEGYKNHLNLELFYDHIINSYQHLQQEDSVKIYQIKKDSLKLSVSESKNKSLYTLLKEQKENNPVYMYMLVVALTGMVAVTFFVIRKNRILSQQEKASREYLEKISENPNGEDYSRLLKALKDNNAAFMFYFEETFPDFTEKLLQINPKMSAYDIEFCALLKIKVSTKDIARYKFIEPATVRNKKYLIKKKLNIPNNVDVYQWFDKF